MSRRENLYYLPGEIQVRERDKHAFASQWYSKVLTHELAGLRSLGCDVDISPEWTIVRKDEQRSSAFYNRVLDVHTSPENLVALLKSLKMPDVKTSIIVNPFTLPNNSESVLTQYGAKHVLSSVILGKDIKQHDSVNTCEVDIANLSPNQKGWGQAINLFAEFFAKTNETENEIEERLRHNISRGLHLFATLRGEPAGLIGVVVFGDTASIYAAAVPEHFRNTRTLSALSQRLSIALFEQGITSVYLKSRNRGAIGYAQRFQGLRYLYTERVYEV